MRGNFPGGNRHVRRDRRNDDRHDAEDQILGQNHVKPRDLRLRRIAHEIHLHDVHHHAQILARDGQCGLPRIVAGRELLAGDDAVHEHIRKAAQSDDDDHARDHGIEVPRRQHRLEQRRVLADRERQLKAGLVLAARHLHAR